MYEKSNSKSKYTSSTPYVFFELLDTSNAYLEWGGCHNYNSLEIIQGLK